MILDRAAYAKVVTQLSGKDVALDRKQLNALAREREANSRQIQVLSDVAREIYARQITERATGGASSQTDMSAEADSRQQLFSPSYSPHSRDSLTGMVQTSGIA